MRRVMPLVLAIVVVGCNGTAETTTTTTAAATTTTVAETTTTAAETTTTVAAPETTTTTAASSIAFTVGEPTLAPPGAIAGGDGASGSGCAPGTGDLPDGVWFGYVIARSATDVDFDLACFYFGDIAYDEGAKDGEEVNNDYYVRNANPALRTVAVDPTVSVYEITFDTSFATVAFADWPLIPDGYIACPSDWCGVWLYVNDGRVTEIAEQYIP